MKDPKFGLMAYYLLDAATALAGILEQRIEKNCVRVNYQFASELIRDMQMTAKLVADELMLMEEEKGCEA